MTLSQAQGAAINALSGTMTTNLPKPAEDLPPMNRPS
jgi:hypothetical protein